MQKATTIEPRLIKDNPKASIHKERQFEIGNNIRKWRILKGIKQELLADELEISKAAISKIETGKTDIPLSRLSQIASVLNIKIELLFTDPFILIQKDYSLNQSEGQVN